MANGHGGARPNTGRKRKTLPAEMIETALDRLGDMVEAGDMRAINLVIERHIPVLKAVSTGIDAELVKAKIQEITIMAQRLDELERQLNEGKGDGA